MIGGDYLIRMHTHRLHTRYYLSAPRQAVCVCKYIALKVLDTLAIYENI